MIAPRRPGALAWLASALLLAAATPAGAAFETEVFSEGSDRPKLMLARRPGEQATISITFSSGSFDDGGRSGLTRLTQRALLESNGRLDWERFVTELYAAGASLSIDTGLRQSGFTLTAHRKDFARLSRTLVEAVLAPRLLPDRLPRALARTLHDGSDPSHGSGLIALLTAVAAEDPRFRNEPYGDREQIEFFTDGDVSDHLAGPFAPARATIVVTGRFDRDEMLRLLRRFHGGVGVAPVKAALSLPAISQFRSAGELVVLGFPIRLSSPQDAAAARVVAGLARQELWRTFRRQGVAYSFTVEPVCLPWIDLLMVILPTGSDSPDGVDQALRAALERVRSGQFDDEALAREVAAASAALLEADARAPDLAAALAAGGPQWHGAGVAAAMRALDRTAVRAAAFAWLDQTRLISLVFAPGPPTRRR
jgi:predicted Zn-dependent peptidase